MGRVGNASGWEGMGEDGRGGRESCCLSVVVAVAVAVAVAVDVDVVVVASL